MDCKCTDITKVIIYNTSHLRAGLGVGGGLKGEEDGACLLGCALHMTVKFVNEL